VSPNTGRATAGDLQHPANGGASHWAVTFYLVDAHEFLDALAMCFASALPDDFLVTTNHDFEAGAREDREDQEDLFGKTGSHVLGSAYITTHMEVVEPGSERFAALAERLSRPSTTELQFRHGETGTGTFLRSFLYEGKPPKQDGTGPDLDAKALLGASLHALDDLQDWLCEETHDPWPRQGQGAVPAPGARVSNGELHLWFGSEDDPVLRLPAIGVGDVGDAVPDQFREDR
jgi:hypothetical protein